jgi:predicted transcriptional regulator
MNSIRQILQWLILGSKGGKTRQRILLLIKKKPLNTNLISKEMKMDYKTVQHHLTILEKNSLITKVGNKYGQVYFISIELEDEFDYFKKLIGEND